MNTNIKLIKLAHKLNLFGNFCIYSGVFFLISQSLLFVNSFRNTVNKAKKELVDNFKVFSEEEFNQIVKQSEEKAREDLISLYFGMFFRDIYANRKWSERALSDCKNCLYDLNQFFKRK